jgi:hypothetical protein
MSMSRDMQFAGFAKALWNELSEAGYLSLAHQPDFAVYFEDDALKMIAQRAYDLVAHTLEHAPLSEYVAFPKDIPDMPELPKEQQ